MCLIVERVTLVIFGANERMVIDLMRCLFHVGRWSSERGAPAGSERREEPRSIKKRRLLIMITVPYSMAKHSDQTKIKLLERTRPLLYPSGRRRFTVQRSTVVPGQTHSALARVP